MELEAITKRMAEFDQLVEPHEIVTLVGYIGQFITHYELEYDESKIVYSVAWDRLKYAALKLDSGKLLTDKQTDIQMLRSEEYASMMRIKRTLGELRRYRSDLTRKLEVIMGIKRK